MKHIVLILPLAIVAALLAPIMDNIVQPTTTFAPTARQQTVRQRDSIFYGNPLLLNNRLFDYANFSMTSRGILTMVAGNPKTEEIEEIPFIIYLRRDGKIINRGASDTTRAVMTVDVASVLAIAKAGDYLVIEPTRKSDARARRIIKLKEGFFNPNLLSFLKKGDGC